MFETFLAMDPWLLATFMGAAFILYITPGADMMFTIASGVEGGPRAGLAAAFGISCGVMVHCCLAAIGLAAVVATNPALLDVIRWFGAVYLAWLAWQAWNASPVLNTAQGSATMWRAARRGFVTNILNPKVGLFVLAFLPQFTEPNAGPIWHQIIILGICLTFGGVLTDGVIGYFAGLAADRVRRSAGRLNKISAIIFGGLAARLALN